MPALRPDAVALDTVAATFGEGLRPATLPTPSPRCYFVEPERRIQVRFAISGGRTTGDSENKPVTIAGHPGYVTLTPSFISYTVSTTLTVDGDSALELTVATGPLIAYDTPLPPGSDKKAESAITDIVRAHFS